MGLRRMNEYLRCMDIGLDEGKQLFKPFSKTEDAFKTEVEMATCNVRTTKLVRPHVSTVGSTEEEEDTCGDKRTDRIHMRHSTEGKTRSGSQRTRKKAKNLEQNRATRYSG